MSALSALPEWAAILVAILVLAGAAITLIGTVGLIRFPTFYMRIHAPTLGSSLGAALVLLASSLYFSIALARPMLHEVLIFACIIVTTPITLMLLARSALYRDRAEGNDGIPAIEPVNRDDN
ncbi:monovalent cation/H(+) antiporter subunit G [Devosia ginsengisoli]|uniref:monovalent cation/H(+) antiporter subunit G n=1 Tax=Devosia ginsengisoli TaxID=400770 RepID=UPI0026F1E93C|nr:monovalent cation/H(+) antiporter subunit G [Devosia ginsengisoli]MCR6671722.1 monovalent cation/H(+) antiporter subunit G [Devosia ginsengisoli]